MQAVIQRENEEQQQEQEVQGHEVDGSENGLPGQEDEQVEAQEYEYEDGDEEAAG